MEKPQIVTIQKTSKPYKLAQLIGVILMLCSIGGCIASASDPGATMFLSAFAGIAGLGVFFFGRVGAWWDHG